MGLCLVYDFEDLGKGQDNQRKYWEMEWEMGFIVQSGRIEDASELQSILLMKPKRRSQLKDQNINSKLLGSDINNANIQKYREQALGKKQRVNLNGKISSDILKSLSNKFSPEIIFTLNISGQGIASIEALFECENMMVLNISANSIENLQPLSKMRNLWILNASKNTISSLQPLSNFENLVNLHIEGNNIKQINSIKPLTECPSLLNLSLQNVLNTETNPICETSGYRKNLLSMFQKLRRLDGVPKSMELNPGKDLANNNRKDVKMELKSSGAFYASKFPSVTGSYQPLTGEGEFKKSIDSCKADITSLERLIKLALGK